MYPMYYIHFIYIYIHLYTCVKVKVDIVIFDKQIDKNKRQIRSFSIAVTVLTSKNNVVY
jgi:hypothetical protein